MNTFKILKIASEINGMTSDELQVLAECLNESTGGKLSDFMHLKIQTFAPIYPHLPGVLCTYY